MDVKLILIQNNQIVSKLIIYLESILTNQQVESLSLEKKKKKKSRIKIYIYNSYYLDRDGLGHSERAELSYFLEQTREHSFFFF